MSVFARLVVLFVSIFTLSEARAQPRVTITQMSDAGEDIDRGHNAICVGNSCQVALLVTFVETECDVTADLWRPDNRKLIKLLFSKVKCHPSSVGGFPFIITPRFPKVLKLGRNASVTETVELGLGVSRNDLVARSPRDQTVVRVDAIFPEQ
jgi:hypothetical protein